MEDSIIQRVNTFLKENSLTVTSVARQLQVSQTTLSMQLRGERALSAGIIEKFLRAFPGISAEWVMRGTGSINLADEDAVDPKYDLRSLKQEQSDSVWQAKYEELEKRYDQLLDILGGNAQKRNVG